MPGSLKTEAIVLRSMRYGEADRILHLFTPDRGRLSAIAKGVRRAKSRFGGRLEPYFRLQLVLYQGRSDLLTVTSAETVHGHPRLREHGAALDGAARACDAVARMFDDHDPHRGVYHLLANQLALIDADPARATRGNALAFRLKLLLAAGFAPAAGGVHGLRRARAPRRLLRCVGRRRVRGLRGERLRAGPGRARLPRRGARPPARRGARRAAARARPGRARDPRDARAPREPAPSSRGTVTNLRSPPVRAGPRVRMVRVSTPAVEPAFEARIRAWEEAALAPYAARSYPGRPRAGRGGLRAAHAVPARPRPDRALQGVPPAQAQDAGVRRARGRPLPHAAHAHDRDDADQPHRGAGAAAQRGPDGGDRARARPRAPAVRAHRRGRARPRRARALRPRLPPQRALAARRRA